MAPSRTAVLLLAMSAGPVLAQTPTASSSGFPASAAAAALGDAFPLATGGAEVVFYHPGGVGRAAGVAMNMSASARPGANFSAAGAMNWFGGTVAVGIQNASYGAGTPGADGLAEHEVDLGRNGPNTASETAVSVAFAHEVGPIDLGVTGRLFSVRSGGTQDRAAAVDVGGALDVGVGVAALSVRALGPNLELGPDEVSLPTTVSLGFGTRRRPVGPIDIMLSAAVDRLDDGDFRPGGGVELSYWPVQGRTFAARFGYDHATPGDPASGFTMGGALMGDDFNLDYAWGRLDDDQSVHRFGVSWR